MLGTKRVAIYVRVSTQEQANEGYSIGAQTERLEAYCKSRDWTIAKIYTDPGFSGAKVDRPALQSMISDIVDGVIDIVLVYKLDRLSRSQKDTLYLIEDVFLKNNVSFVSVNENFDTSTAFGRAMIGILSVFAQLEREQIKERTMMGNMERAKDGYFHGGGYAPIGYNYVNGELIIDEYEAMQVKKVYELFLKGEPIHAIQRYMSEHYTTKYSSWAHDTCVTSCLKQKVYIGKIEWKGKVYDGRHEAIIEEDVFNQAAVLLKKRALKNTENPFEASKLLTGILRCDCCGGRYFAKGVYGGHAPNRIYKSYYYCYSRGKSTKKLIKDPNCKSLVIATNELDYLVVSEIRKLSFEDDYIYHVIDSQNGNKEAEKTIKLLEKKLKELEEQEKRMLDLYQLGNLPLETISERIAEINEKRNGINSEISSLNADNNKMSISTAKDILQGADDIFNTGTINEQRAFLSSLIDYIGLSEDKMTIHWRFA